MVGMTRPERAYPQPFVQDQRIQDQGATRHRPVRPLSIPHAMRERVTTPAVSTVPARTRSCVPWEGSSTRCRGTFSAPSSTSNG